MLQEHISVWGGVKGGLKQYKKCGAPIHTSRAIHTCPYHDETQSMSQEMPLGSKQIHFSLDLPGVDRGPLVWAGVGDAHTFLAGLKEGIKGFAQPP